ncbi:MAG TPA: hypothetical protein VMN36_17855 [Verrucomicrobiales bacterium]|nr:hypothetical protein [Verrucomicrobiales bacterium]
MRTFPISVFAALGLGMLAGFLPARKALPSKRATGDAERSTQASNVAPALLEPQEARRPTLLDETVHSANEVRTYLKLQPFHWPVGYVKSLSLPIDPWTLRLEEKTTSTLQLTAAESQIVNGILADLLQRLQNEEADCGQVIEDEGKSYVYFPANPVGAAEVKQDLLTSLGQVVDFQTASAIVELVGNSAFVGQFGALNRRLEFSGGGDKLFRFNVTAYNDDPLNTRKYETSVDHTHILNRFGLFFAYK